MTTAYVLFMLGYVLVERTNVLKMTPDEFATFLAGVFSPLAFLWLVLGFLQQGQELRQSSKALWLQGEELRNSVEQQRSLVEVSRQQLDFERERISAENEVIKHRALPNFRFGGGASMRGGPNSMMMSFWVMNRGQACNDCDITWMGRTYVSVPLFETGGKRDFSIELMDSENDAVSDFVVTFTDALGNPGSVLQPVKVVTRGTTKYLELVS